MSLNEPDADEVAYAPGRWWRVMGPDRSLWCETSVEQEARDRMRPGDTLEREYRAELVMWRAVPIEAAAVPRPRLTAREAALGARWWLEALPGRVWAAARFTGRFLAAFPVLAAALAQRWAAEARAVADQEYARGFDAGVIQERQRQERDR